MTAWTLETAKARLSQVVRCALTDGPQEVTVRGKSTVFVVATEEFRPPKDVETMSDVLARLRAVAGEEGVGFDVEREREDGHRDVVR